MSALYQISYQGIAGTGHGALYIGRGVVVGVDVAGGRYKGTYSDKMGAIAGSVKLTSSGAGLVTGQVVPAGTQVQITFDLPQNFANGVHKVVVAGQPVQVRFDKVDDIP
jgi:hypothetical protein